MSSKLIRAASLIGAAVYLLRLATSQKAREKLKAADDALGRLPDITDEPDITDAGSRR
jgi:hypothetical protein